MSRTRSYSRNRLRLLISWFDHQPPMVKSFLGVFTAILALIFIRFSVGEPDTFFIVAELIHALGIGVLIYKLGKKNTCAGLSLKSQQLTAVFLGVRLYCSMVLEYNIHTVLDMATLLATCWVIYMMSFKLKESYMRELDNTPAQYLVVTCGVLAFFIHPTTSHFIVNRLLWAFCVYLEAVSIVPQLQVMRNTKVVEPFTAHYAFALGVARFLSFAHWIFQVLDTWGLLLTASGYVLWPAMVLIAEVVQTAILADFCYYYVKSVIHGESIILPS